MEPLKTDVPPDFKTSFPPALPLRLLSTLNMGQVPVSVKLGRLSHDV